MTLDNLADSIKGASRAELTGSGLQLTLPVGAPQLISYEVLVNLHRNLPEMIRILTKHKTSLVHLSGCVRGAVQIWTGQSRKVKNEGLFPGVHILALNNIQGRESSTRVYLCGRIAHTSTTPSGMVYPKLVFPDSATRVSMDQLERAYPGAKHKFRLAQQMRLSDIELAQWLEQEPVETELNLPELIKAVH